MKDGLSYEAIEGLFENIKENEDKIADFKSQIKTFTSDSSDQFKEFSKDNEIEVKSLKAAYKYWKERQDGNSETDEDYFSLLTMIDSYFENDAENEKE
jgi:accessory colonization factor AcfC